MFAVVEISGKQYEVEKGMQFLVDFQNAKKDSELKFKTVTVIKNDGKIVIGAPFVDKAVVEAKIIEEKVSGEKLTVFKYKPKVNYSKKTGHRQKYTKLEILNINI